VTRHLGEATAIRRLSVWVKASANVLAWMKELANVSASETAREKV
jgi:hypothetical protein